MGAHCVKVLHLFDAAVPPAARAVLGLVRRLRGDAAVRIGPDEAGEAPEADFAVRRTWPGPVAEWMGFGAKAGELPGDLLHCWSPHLAAAVAGMGRPSVVSVFVRPGREAARSLRTAGRKGAAIVAGSDALAGGLIADGVPAACVTVIPPAAESRPIDPAARAAAREGLGLGEAQLLAVTVAEHRHDRGPYWCVWAAEILHQLSLPVDVGLLGDRHAVAYARRFARDTEGLGAVFADVDDATLWAAADAAVLYEPAGAGLATAATALAAGVPIIAADAGELAKTLTSEQTALLVEPAEPRRLARALQRLLDQPEWRASLATAGDDPAVRHLLNPAGMVARLEGLYAHLAGRDARQPGRSMGSPQ